MTLVTVRAACRMRCVRSHFGGTPAEWGGLNGADLKENVEWVHCVSKLCGECWSQFLKCLSIKAGGYGEGNCAHQVFCS